LINVTVLNYGIADIAFEIGRHFCQLNGEGSKEFVSFGKITSTSREEETGSETVLIVKNSGDRTNDSGFIGIDYAIQSKDIFIARIVAPYHQLPEEIDF
jgi:hypothetical protein